MAATSCPRSAAPPSPPALRVRPASVGCQDVDGVSQVAQRSTHGDRGVRAEETERCCHGCCGRQAAKPHGSTKRSTAQERREDQRVVADDLRPVRPDIGMIVCVVRGIRASGRADAPRDLDGVAGPSDELPAIGAVRLNELRARRDSAEIHDVLVEARPAGVSVRQLQQQGVAHRRQAERDCGEGHLRDSVRCCSCVARVSVSISEIPRQPALQRITFARSIR